MKIRKFKEFIKGYCKAYDLFNIIKMNQTFDFKSMYGNHAKDNNIQKAWKNVGNAMWSAIEVHEDYVMEDFDIIKTKKKSEDGKFDGKRCPYGTSNRGNSSHAKTQRCTSKQK